MLHIWDAIEADFLRDYRIVLMERLDHMTWRYFLTLMNNLSPNGAVAVRVRSELDSRNKDGSTDEKQAEAFFTSIVSVG